MAKKEKKEKRAKVTGVMSPADAMAVINAKFGASSIMAVKDSMGARMDRISYGILQLDIDTGGGIPYGKAALLFGREASGKSTVSLKLAASFQNHCRKCRTYIFPEDAFIQKKPGCQCGANEPMIVAYIDLEKKLDGVWAKKNGVNLDTMLVSQPTVAEEAMDQATYLIENKVCDLLIFDSLAAATPSVEYEESFFDQQIGAGARLVNKFIRGLLVAQKQGGQNCQIQPTVILVNQPRLKIGVLYGNPETLPMGQGQHFYVTQKIRMKDEKMEEGKDGGAHYDMSWTIQKNSAGGAIKNKEGSCKFWTFGDENHKVCSTGDEKLLVDIARKLELIIGDSGKYKIEGIDQVFKTLDDMEAMLMGSKRLYHGLRDKIIEIICGDVDA